MTDSTENTDPQLMQFPSAVGEDAIEVEKRTVDPEIAPEGNRFGKRFVILGDKPGKDFDHKRYHRVVLSEAINQGLHPKSEVELTGSARHPDGKSWNLDYSVEVVPAHVDHERASTLTPTYSEVPPSEAGDLTQPASEQ